MTYILSEITTDILPRDGLVRGHNNFQFICLTKTFHPLNKRRGGAKKICWVGLKILSKSQLYERILFTKKKYTHNFFMVFYLFLFDVELTL